MDGTRCYEGDIALRFASRLAVLIRSFIEVFQANRRTFTSLLDLIPQVAVIHNQRMTEGRSRVYERTAESIRVHVRQMQYSHRPDGACTWRYTRF